MMLIGISQSRGELFLFSSSGKSISSLIFIFSNLISLLISSSGNIVFSTIIVNITLKAIADNEITIQLNPIKFRLDITESLTPIFIPIVNIRTISIIVVIMSICLKRRSDNLFNPRINPMPIQTYGIHTIILTTFVVLCAVQIY